MSTRFCVYKTETHFTHDGLQYMAVKDNSTDVYVAQEFTKLPSVTRLGPGPGVIRIVHRVTPATIPAILGKNVEKSSAIIKEPAQGDYRPVIPDPPNMHVIYMTEGTKLWLAYFRYNKQATQDVFIPLAAGDLCIFSHELFSLDWRCASYYTLRASFGPAPNLCARVYMVAKRQGKSDAFDKDALDSNPPLEASPDAISKSVPPPPRIILPERRAIKRIKLSEVKNSV